MIEVSNLTKFYGHILGIQDVSFTVEKGEILGFLGPNGAGKSTTMRILTCFIPPTSGTAKVAGFDIFNDSMEVRKRIGYMPENVPVYSEMVVRDYLKFVAEVKGVPGRSKDAEVDRVIEECGLREVEKRTAGKISKGYRQRLGMAQALIGNPEVLILDEPTIGLDPRQIIEIRQLIKDLSQKEERTIILSSHILPEVSQLCQRIIIINKGRLVASDTPDNLNKQLQKSRRIYALIEGPPEAVKNKILEINDVMNIEATCVTDQVCEYFIESYKDKDIRKELASQIVSNGWGLLELRQVGLSLEDIFIELVTEEEEVEKETGVFAQSPADGGENKKEDVV